ncbi:hypothetical protein MPSEU_000155800 [Mayamaea pseudoterrestris]|nr:hypothetical protein MPSEU_000155800 [Mayamaea pseudoterrestris]
MAATSPVGIDLGGNYTVGAHLASGAQCSIHSVLCNGYISLDYVVKCAPLPPARKPKAKPTKLAIDAASLNKEANIYPGPLRPLQGTAIPRFGFDNKMALGRLEIDGFRFLVLERMDHDLFDGLHKMMRDRTSNGSINLNPILMRMLEIIKEIHGANHVLVDVKADNVMFAMDQTKQSRKTLHYDNDELARLLRCVDFGLAQPITKYSPAIAENPQGKLVGTPLYCSRKVHAGFTAAPRDDLEAIGLVACDLIIRVMAALDGTTVTCNKMDVPNFLPWAHEAGDDAIGAKKVAEMDNEQSDFYALLGAAGPTMFNYFEVTGALEHKEKPDYGKLMELLSEVNVAPSASKAGGRKTAASARSPARAAKSSTKSPAKKPKPFECPAAAAASPAGRRRSSRLVKEEAVIYVDDDDEEDEEEEKQVAKPVAFRANTASKSGTTPVVVVKSIASNKKMPAKRATRQVDDDDDEEEEEEKQIAKPVAFRVNAASKSGTKPVVVVKSIASNKKMPAKRTTRQNTEDDMSLDDSVETDNESPVVQTLRVISREDYESMRKTHKSASKAAASSTAKSASYVKKLPAKRTTRQVDEDAMVLDDTDDEDIDSSALTTVPAKDRKPVASSMSKIGASTKGKSPVAAKTKAVAFTVPKTTAASAAASAGTRKTARTSIRATARVQVGVDGGSVNDDTDDFEVSSMDYMDVDFDDDDDNVENNVAMANSANSNSPKPASGKSSLTVLVTQGPHKNSKFVLSKLNDSLIIGNGRAASKQPMLVLDKEKNISSCHCQLAFDMNGETPVISLTAKSNGVYVGQNVAKVGRSMTLMRGATFKIGQTVIEIVM